MPGLKAPRALPTLPWRERLAGRAGLWLALVPALLYLASFWPYWTDAASLDPLLIYHASARFADGGLAELVKVTGGSTHPPGVFSLYVLGFKLFGKAPAAVADLGLIVVLAESLATYALVRRLWGDTAGGLAALFLGCHAMVQVHSFYLGWEALMVPLLIVALYGYVYDRIGWLAAALALLPLCKETGLVYGPAFALLLGAEAWRRRRGLRATAIRLALLVAPALVVFKLWQALLHRYGATEWSQGLMDRRYGGAFATVIGYALAGKTFNVFLAQNCFNAFMMNFQWLFTAAAAALLVSGRRTVDSTPKVRLVAGLILVQVPYILFVFSFPTWTIPRYAVAVAPMVMVPLGIFLAVVPHRLLRAGLASAVVVALALSNVASLDPLTAGGRTEKVWGEDLYALDRTLRGVDGVVYNRQFAAGIHRENAFLAAVYATDAEVLVGACQRLRLELKLTMVAALPDYYPTWAHPRSVRCVLADDVRTKESARAALAGLRVALSRADAADVAPLLAGRVKSLSLIE